MNTRIFIFIFDTENKYYELFKKILGKFNTAN